MKFTQGTAPAVLFEDGKIAFEFTAGRLETEDAALAAKLVEAGAVAVDAAEDSATQQDAQGIKCPKGYTGLNKQDAVDKAKAELGIEISVNQSKADIMAQIAEAIAAKEPAAAAE